MDEPPLKLGAVFGAASFLVGYLITLVVVAVGEADEISDDLMEGAGWMYYNAQFAPVELSFDEGGELFEGMDTSFNYVTGGEFFGESFSTDVPSVIYHLIPIVVLIAAGFLLAKKVNAADPKEGAIAGATLVLGTIVLAILGTFIFSDTEQGVTLAPALVEGVLLVGIIFPALFGAIGGVLSTKA